VQLSQPSAQQSASQTPVTQQQSQPKTQLPSQLSQAQVSQQQLVEACAALLLELNQKPIAASKAKAARNVVNLFMIRILEIKNLGVKKLK